MAANIAPKEPSDQAQAVDVDTDLFGRELRKSV